MNTKYQSGLDSNQIRTLRHKFNLRQKDVADIMGFEVIDRLSHWERGRSQPGLINTIRLCKLYNVSIDDLYPELCEQIQTEIMESENRNFLKIHQETDPFDSLRTS